jgi:hypothetical protein
MAGDRPPYNQQRGSTLPNAARHLSVAKHAPLTEDGKVEGLDHDYPDTYLECRALQHRWKRIGLYHAYGEIVRVLTCERCGCDRRDYWSARGVRLRNSTYDHPDGYSIGNGGVSSHEVRKELISRVQVYDTEAEMRDAIFGTDAQKRRSAG